MAAAAAAEARLAAAAADSPAARVTRYDPISIWDIDMGDRTSMR
jgi:hypothetical protein